MSEEIKTEQTADQTTAVTATLWAKLKTLYATIKSRTIAFFATVAVRLETLWNSRPWVKYAIVAVVLIAVAGGVGYWRDRQLVSQIYMLQSENQAKAEQIKAVEAEKKDLLIQIDELKKKLTATQIKNDSNIKEAGKNEYKKVMSLKDVAVIDYYNNVYRPGVVQRNATRKQANGGNNN